MYCTRCGLQAYPEDRFCAGCGAPLSRETKTTEKAKPIPVTEDNKTTKQIDQTPVKIPVRPEPTTKVIKIGPIGVKGWLLFLVIGLMIIGPLVSIGNIEKNFINTENNYPNLVSFDKWKSYKSSIWASTFICIALSIYAGLGLTTGNNWKVVKRAIGILLIIGPLAILLMGAIIPLIIFGSIKEMIPAIINSFFVSLLWASLWALYLLKSKRVRNTYGRNKSSK